MVAYLVVVAYLIVVIYQLVVVYLVPGLAFAATIDCIVLLVTVMVLVGTDPLLSRHDSETSTSLTHLGQGR